MTKDRPRYQTVYLSADCLKDLQPMIRQRPATEAAVLRIISNLLTDHQVLHQRSPIHHPKFRVFHTKLSEGDRVLDIELDHGPETVLARAGGHHINEVGARWNTPPSTLVDKSSPVTTAAEAARVIPGRRPRATEAIQAPPVRAPSEDDTLLLAAEPTVEPYDASPPEDAGAAPSPLGEPVEHSPDPSPRIATPIPGHEPTALAFHADDLPHLMQVPLHRFLTTLTDEQRRLIERSPDHILVVQGPAGSGKTVVGLRRLEWFHRQPSMMDDRPLGWLTFNKTLSQAAEDLLASLVGQPAAEADIETRTVDSVLHDVVSEALQRRFDLATANVEWQQLAYRIVDRAPLGPHHGATLTGATFKTIVLEHILPHGLDRERFRAAPLPIRGIPRSLRDPLYDRFLQWEEALLNCTSQPWDWIPWKANAILDQHPPDSPRWRALVVDEVQDLSPPKIEALVRLQAGSTAGMTLLGDSTQSIYRKDFTWASLGLEVRGRVARLTECHRTTHEIKQVAAAVLSDDESRERRDFLTSKVTAPPGCPPVRLAHFTTADEEAQAVAHEVAERVTRDVPWSGVGILVLRKQDMRPYEAALDALEIPYSTYTGEGGLRVRHPSVKISTIHSAKGLEFQVVFLVGLDGRIDKRLHYANTRKLLFTGMTRASWGLYLTSHTTEPALFDRLRAAGAEGWS